MWINVSIKSLKIYGMNWIVYCRYKSKCRHSDDIRWFVPCKCVCVCAAPDLRRTLESAAKGGNKENKKKKEKATKEHIHWKSASIYIYQDQLYGGISNFAYCRGPDAREKPNVYCYYLVGEFGGGRGGRGVKRGRLPSLRTHIGYARVKDVELIVATRQWKRRRLLAFIHTIYLC